MYRAIVDLSPPDWSFVVTNVVRADDPSEARTVTRVHQLAEERPAATWPVRVHCDRRRAARARAPRRIATAATSGPTLRAFGRSWPRTT